MASAWQTDSDHLTCRWSDSVGQRIVYDPDWFHETPEMRGSYLTPVPDFASRSPFGGATWFQPHIVYTPSR